MLWNFSFFFLRKGSKVNDPLEGLPAKALQSHGLQQEDNHQPEGFLTIKVYVSIKPLVITLDFKILLLVNKVLNRLRHEYISDLLAH